MMRAASARTGRHPTRARCAFLAAAVASLASCPMVARAQVGPDSASPSRADSLEWAAASGRAARARGFRVVVSLEARQLWAIDGDDTLRTARVAVGRDAELVYQGRHWRFRTPRGVHRVLRKDSLPVWVPPDWHYYEVAKSLGLTVRRLRAGRAVPLDGGRRLEIRGGVAGIVDPDSGFAPLPTDAEIVADGVLYIPPQGTANRRIAGELGRYRLALADGYSLHGTPWGDSIGEAVTHGCIRLRDDDVAWLYEHVAVGTPVYVY